jgi:hypothetical protein
MRQSLSLIPATITLAAVSVAPAYLYSATRDRLIQASPRETEGSAREPSALSAREIADRVSRSLVLIVTRGKNGEARL